jgi:hypothetical protein
MKLPVETGSFFIDYNVDLLISVLMHHSFPPSVMSIHAQTGWEIFPRKQQAD